ncbi:MAG: oligosaccharide repeat unit polymerase [Prevotella sp.]|nr:oligosaccharide repeat unit polymerase [Prevotella sp.]
MILVPFIYFSLLTFYWWKKHEGFDVCVYMSGLYALTSFLAIIIVANGLLDGGGILFDNYDLELNVIPTVLYCALLTIGMLPFSMVYKKDLKKIYANNQLIVDLLSCFLILVALLNLYLVADSTLEILSGDLSTVRTDHYEGIESPAQVKAESMPYIFRFLYYFNTSTLLAIPLFFYYLCFGRRPWWFAFLLLFSSLSMPIAGIQSADRTEIVLYGMMFVTCLILFRPHLSKKVKTVLKIVSVPIALAAIVYFVVVSDARFSKKDGGAATSALQYAGQGYLNFCFFWEKANTDYIAAEREFPLIAHYAFHVDNDDERRGVRSGQQGFFMSVFATYIGDVMLDLTPIGMILWVIAFFLIAVIILKYPHKEEMNIGEFLMFYVLSIIPVFGVFYYRLMSFTYTFMVILTVILYLTDKYKFIISTGEKTS